MEIVASGLTWQAALEMEDGLIKANRVFVVNRTGMYWYRPYVAPEGRCPCCDQFRADRERGHSPRIPGAKQKDESVP